MPAPASARPLHASEAMTAGMREPRGEVAVIDAALNGGRRVQVAVPWTAAETAAEASEPSYAGMRMDAARRVPSLALL